MRWMPADTAHVGMDEVPSGTRIGNARSLQSMTRTPPMAAMSSRPTMLRNGFTGQVMT